MAEAAAGVDPADLRSWVWPWQFAGGRDVVDDARRGVERVGAQVGAADAGHERVGGRPLDGRERDQRSALADGRCFLPLAVPPSPDEPSTVTPLAAAALNA